MASNRQASQIQAATDVMRITFGLCKI